MVYEVCIFSYRSSCYLLLSFSPFFLEWLWFGLLVYEIKFDGFGDVNKEDVNFGCNPIDKEDIKGFCHKCGLKLLEALGS